jgi:hypothetical protein
MTVTPGFNELHLPPWQRLDENVQYDTADAMKVVRILQVLNNFI